MPDPATIQFHRDARERYLRAWREIVCQPDSLTCRTETAFHLLEHTEMLFFCTGERCVQEDLRSLRPFDLVLGASERIVGMTLTDEATTLLQPDVLDPDQIDVVEMLLLRRHALQGVVSLIRDLADLSDPHQRQAVVRAVSAIAELDDVLLARPDVISVASRILDPVRDDLVVDLPPREYWWLYWARELDAAFDSETVPSMLVLATPPGPFQLRAVTASQRGNAFFGRDDDEMPQAANATPIDDPSPTTTNTNCISENGENGDGKSL